jgi:hypothetical protein
MFLEAQGDFLGAKSFYEQELEKKFNPKNAELGSVGELNIVCFNKKKENDVNYSYSIDNEIGSSCPTP